MTISVTNIGTAQNQGGSLTITVGGGGVPAGSLIFVSVMASGGTSLDNVTDSASRTYTQIQTQSFSGVGRGAGQTVYLANVSLPNGGTINYANGDNNNVCMTACYATGIAPFPLDTAVTAKSTFSTTSSPTVTGGTPTHSGELVIGVVWTSSATATISSQGSFSTPPNFISVSGAASTGGGNLVNAGIGTETYNPTLSASVNCAVCIQAFAPVNAWQGTASLNAASILVPAVVLGLIARAEFDGAGSLSARTIAHLSAGANLSGSPSLSAYGALALQILAEFDGASSLTAIGTRIPPGGIISIFSGGGGLSAVALQTLSSGSIFLGGAGSLLPTVGLGLTASATLVGSGGMHLPLVGTAALSGAGSITVNAIQITLVASLLGTGVLSVNGMRVISVVEQFNGSGRMCAQATVRLGRRGSVSNTVVAGRGSLANIALRGGISSSKPFINYTAEDGVTVYTTEDGVTPYTTECP
jgi:hypothetical protein